MKIITTTVKIIKKIINKIDNFYNRIRRSNMINFLDLSIFLYFRTFQSPDQTGAFKSLSWRPVVGRPSLLETIGKDCYAYLYISSRDILVIFSKSQCSIRQSRQWFILKQFYLIKLSIYNNNEKHNNKKLNYILELDKFGTKILVVYRVGVSLRTAARRQTKSSTRGPSRIERGARSEWVSEWASKWKR